MRPTPTPLPEGITRLYLRYIVDGTDYSVNYPTESADIPANADAFVVSLTRESVDPAPEPDLIVEIGGSSYGWDEWNQTEASTEYMSPSLSGLLKVYNDSFEWNLQVNRTPLY